MPTEFEFSFPIGKFVLMEKPPKVERVLFNGPATILFWDDGQKTVVKCRECPGACCRDEGDNFIDTLLNTTDPLEVLEICQKKANCQFRFDREKAVMAAMLKRLYKNYQDVLRDALEGGEK